MHLSITLFGVLIASIAIPSASASTYKKRNPLKPRQAANTDNDYSTEYWFDQLLDHSNPSAGTFKQRYFFSDQWYAGQGSPIVITTPGEQSADGFYTDLTGASLMNVMLQTWNAGGVVLEHRYWGKSSPYDTLTAPNLQWLTVQQAIEDYKYFVDNVKLPWASGGSYNSSSTATPWVNIGCSYPGLLVAYTQEQYPDLFAGAWATSAPVNADGDFWEYWEPIEEGMPKNCSTDVAAAVSYIDNTLSTGSQTDVTALKAKFGMEAVGNDDFGSALVVPFNTWQDLQAFSYGQDGESTFHKFCDAIETNSDGTQSTNPAGVGMPLALDNWAAAFKASGPDANCPGEGGACYSTYDATSDTYTDTSVSDKYMRGWVWLLCTQLGWFQVGDPGNSSSIVSAQVTPAYFQRQCGLYFPLADGTHSSYNFTQDVTAINTQFKGWNVVGNNLFVVNGEFDPWRSASLSSKWAPEFTDTPTQEITVIPNAHHCWDFYLENTQVDDNVKTVQKQGIEEIHGWLQAWYTAHPDVKNALASVSTAIPGLDAPIDDGTTGTNNTDVNGSNDSGINELKDKIDELAANKKLALASYIVNVVLALLLILCIVLLVLAKRKKHTRVSESSSILPKWSKGGREIHEGDQLGEYGSGGAAGGRGKYQQLKEQTS